VRTGSGAPASGGFAEIVHLGVDIALLVLVLEAIALCIFHWRTGRGLSFLTIGLISLSGFGLLIALKAALLQAGVHWIGFGLALGGIAHAIDLTRRIREHLRSV
jgi:hypothetical protein